MRSLLRDCSRIYLVNVDCAFLLSWYISEFSSGFADISSCPVGLTIGSRLGHSEMGTERWKQSDQISSRYFDRDWRLFSEFIISTKYCRIPDTCLIYHCRDASKLSWESISKSALVVCNIWINQSFRDTDDPKPKWNRTHIYSSQVVGTEQYCVGLSKSMRLSSKQVECNLDLSEYAAYTVIGVVLITLGMIALLLPFILESSGKILETIPPIVLWVYRKDNFTFVTSPILIIVSILCFILCLASKKTWEPPHLERNFYDFSLVECSA